MRARILIPILILLIAFCGVLGFAVYSNISASTYDLLNKQIDDTLTIIENRFLEAKSQNVTINDQSFQELIAGMGIVDGGVFVVNERGIVIADTREIMTGYSLADSEWFHEARQSLRGVFFATYGRTEVFAHSVVLDGRLVVSYLSGSAVDALMITPIYVIGVVGIISATLMGIIIYFLITRLLINPVESLDEQIGGLAKGEEIDVDPLKRCPETASAARQLNMLMELQAVKETHLRQALEEGTAVGAAQTTSFELVVMLRDVFEQHRKTVETKKIRFSLKVDNDLPHIIFGDRGAMAARLSFLLSKAFDKSRPGSLVDAEILLLPSELAATSGDIAIAFDVRCEGWKDRVLLIAKKG